MLADIFGPDLLIVAIVLVVLLFGGAAIPKLARNLGSAKNQFEKGMKEGKAEGAAANGTSAAADTPAPSEEKSPGRLIRRLRSTRRRTNERGPCRLTSCASPSASGTGSSPPRPSTPSTTSAGFVEITDGVGFCPSFANVSSFATEDGLRPRRHRQRTAGPGGPRRHPTLEPGPPQYRRLLPRSHRPRLRSAGLGGGGGGTGAGPRPRSSPTTRCRRASTVTSSPRGTTRSSIAASSASPIWSGRPSTAIPTAPTTTTSTSRSAASASRCATRRARPTTTRSPGSPTRGCSVAATCSSGPRPTRATPRRCSATRASGRTPCGACSSSTPSSSSPDTGSQSSGRTVSARP